MYDYPCCFGRNSALVGEHGPNMVIHVCDEAKKCKLLLYLFYDPSHNHMLYTDIHSLMYTAHVPNHPHTHAHKRLASFPGPIFLDGAWE